MIHPHSASRRVWDGLVALLLLYGAFNTPLAVAFDFDDPPAHRGLDLLVALFFCADLVLCFFMGTRPQVEHAAPALPVDSAT